MVNNVSIKAKEALKEGNTKKKYKMVFENVETGAMLIATIQAGQDFTIPEVGSYKLKIETPASLVIDVTWYRTFPQSNIYETWLTDGEVTEYDFTISQLYNRCVINVSGTQEDIEVYKTGAGAVGIYTIDNSSLVTESVKIDERLCSEQKLKFGLCEGSSIEFRCFSSSKQPLPNLKNKIFAVTLAVETDDGYESIPMGKYTVDKIARQASTGILQITAYNKLKSSYLDKKANQDIIDYINQQVSTQGVSISLILDGLLANYSVHKNYLIPSYTPDEQSFYTVQAYGQYYLCDSDGNRIIDENGYETRLAAAPVGSRDFTISDFSTTKPYRLWINWRGIYEKILSYVPSGKLRQKYRYNANIGSTFSDPYTLDELIKNAVLQAGAFFIVRTRENQNYQTDIQYLTDSNVNNDSYVTNWYTGLSNATAISFNIPTYWLEYTAHQSSRTRLNDLIPYDDLTRANRLAAEIVMDQSLFQIQEYTETGIEAKRITLSEAQSWPDVTLRELQSAVYETECLFGKLDRSTDLFSGIELNQSRLFPTNSLYPAASLYPDGGFVSSNKSMYSKLWADEDNVQKWRYLIITYQDTNGNEQTLQRTVNADGTQDYNCSDNWIFLNLQWTAEQIGVYADTMVAKMQNITWFPFELWCAGLPYLETGDEIEIALGEETYTSYILQRNLNGIQNLQDTYINGELDIF